MTIEPHPDREPLRVGDIERGQAITQLQQAGLEGRLSAAEVDERITLAQQAKTQRDLERLIIDLPVRRTISRPEEKVELRSNVGSIKRRGVWTVPRRLVVNSGTGSVRLDFSDVRSAVPDSPTGTAPHFRITGHTGTGRVLVRYPRRHIFDRRPSR